MDDAARFLSGLRSFDAQGVFTEDDYAALKRLVSDVGRVEAAVLYTHTPQLFALPPDLIEAHKSALSPAE